MTKKKVSKAKKHPKSKEETVPEDKTASSAKAAASASAGSAASSSAASSAGDVEAAASSGPSLQEQLEAALKTAEENWDQLLRTKAEMENLRKRAQRDIENAHKFGLDKIANELLGVRDSMELGLGAAEESADVKSLREGAELTLKMLTQVMERFGIQEVNPVHQRFNPELHQAMTMQESDQLEPNTVIAVIQKGYTLNDRLLRPALVTVSKAPETSTNGDE